MNLASNPLKDLRDIHLPAPISSWPLASGWYVIAVLGGLALMVLGVLLYRYLKKVRPRRAALKQLDKLQQNYQQKQTPAVVSELSILIRRCALSAFPRHNVAGLEGEAWLAFLNETGQTEVFTQGVGKLLMTAPYQKHTKENLEDLFELTQKWVVKTL